MYRVLASFRKTRLFILVFALKFEVGTKNYENSSEMESHFISLQCLGNHPREILTRLKHLSLLWDILPKYSADIDVDVGCF